MFLLPALLLGLFACGEKSGNPAGAQDNVSQTADGAPQAAISAYIAYVELDSLLSNYNLYVDKNAELTAKAKKAETELANKMRSLEKTFADAQEKINKGLVTRSEATQLQEDLQRQEQALYAHRDKVQGELAEEGQVLMNNIINNLDTFLAEFNADYKYSMILTTSGNTPVLHADPRLNITNAVLEGLNAKYAEEKKAAETKK